MSQPEPKPAPTLSVRLKYWFGVYLVSALLLSADQTYICNADAGLVSELIPLALGSFILILLCFPMLAVLGFIDAIIPTATTNQVSALILVVSGAASYMIYATALWFAWNARTQRAFRYAMLGLLVLVGLNLIGCHHQLIESKAHPAPEQD